MFILFITTNRGSKHLKQNRMDVYEKYIIRSLFPFFFFLTLLDVYLHLYHCLRLYYGTNYFFKKVVILKLPNWTCSSFFCKIKQKPFLDFCKTLLRSWHDEVKKKHTHIVVQIQTLWFFLHHFPSSLHYRKYCMNLCNKIKKHTPVYFHRQADLCSV